MRTTTDPIEMLREDHRKVKELFKEFEATRDEEEKRQIIQRVLKELKVHTALEEEIFYPKVRVETHETELVDQSLEEHHVAKILIGELESMEPEGEHYEAKFKVLVENVKLHFQQEEAGMLPKAEQAEFDKEELGEKMAERKQELLDELETDEMEKTPPYARKSNGRHSAKGGKAGKMKKTASRLTSKAERRNYANSIQKWRESQK